MLNIEGLKLPNNLILDFNLRIGESILLKGENGVGKSLLLKSLARLLPLEYKKFQYLEKDLSSWNLQEYRSQILYLPPSPTAQSMSIEDFFEVIFKMKIYEGHKPLYLYRDYLDKWKITNSHFNELSSGQKQILSLLRAVSLKARVLLLDEPVAHLDTGMAAEAFNLLRDWQIKTEGQIILVSHAESKLEQFQFRDLRLS
ncbi:MAG: ATP-binding cassette domain-containing protein [Bacteriovoracaceae bacterium]|nr:ATP-binding cassette domain-containing protein [Bacteriovoracaceae bacterium]